jgi:tetratricopeptide (TPR) repeat protein
VEPIAAITMFYPFLSQESKSVVEQLVEDALSYHEFIHALVDAAEAHPITSDLACFTFFQARMYPDTHTRVQEKLLESELTKPFSFWTWEQYWLSGDKLIEFENAMEIAESLGPPSWILIHLYGAAGSITPDPYYRRYVDLALGLIESEPNLRCFSPLFLMFEAYHKRAQGDLDGSYRTAEQALGIAREVNDIVQVTWAISVMANTIKDSDVHKALQLLDDAYSDAVSILDEDFATFNLALNMALCYEALGEYDMALKLLHKDFEVNARFLDKPDNTLATVASRIYCTLNMPEQALEWLREHSETLQFGFPIGHTNTAKALILLDRLDEAALHLSKAHKKVLDLGDDQFMYEYLFVQGLYDLAIGELSSAVDNLEQALKLADPVFQIGMNRILSALTQVEIRNARESHSAQIDTETSGGFACSMRFSRQSTRS